MSGIEYGVFSRKLITAKKTHRFFGSIAVSKYQRMPVHKVKRAVEETLHHWTPSLNFLSIGGLFVH